MQFPIYNPNSIPLPEEDMSLAPEATKSVDKATIIAVFDLHHEAAEAVRHLQESGFDMTKFSIIGKDFATDEDVIGYYNVGKGMRFWGTLGAFWGGMTGLLMGSAVFFIPGVGPLVAAGPIVNWLIVGLEGAVVVGSMSALAAALLSLGVPGDFVFEYEMQIKAGKFLLLIHGTDSEIADACKALEDAGIEVVDDPKPMLSL